MNGEKVETIRKEKERKKKRTERYNFTDHRTHITNSRSPISFVKTEQGFTPFFDKL